MGNQGGPSKIVCRGATRTCATIDSSIQQWRWRSINVTSFWHFFTLLLTVTLRHYNKLSHLCYVYIVFT